MITTVRTEKGKKMSIYRNEEGRWIMSTNNPDVVEVVRCKDCKHYWKNTRVSDEPVVCLASAKDDAFCSEGERK